MEESEIICKRLCNMSILRRFVGKSQIALKTYLHRQRWLFEMQSALKGITMSAITITVISTATNVMFERIIHLVTTPLIHLRSCTIRDVT